MVVGEQEGRVTRAMKAREVWSLASGRLADNIGEHDSEAIRFLGQIARVFDGSNGRGDSVEDMTRDVMYSTIGRLDIMWLTWAQLSGWDWNGRDDRPLPIEHEQAARETLRRMVVDILTEMRRHDDELINVGERVASKGPAYLNPYRGTVARVDMSSRWAPPYYMVEWDTGTVTTGETFGTIARVPVDDVSDPDDEPWPMGDLALLEVQLAADAVTEATEAHYEV